MATFRITESIVDDLVTTTVAARIIGRDRSTIRRLIGRDLLPITTVCGIRFVRASQVRQLAKEQIIQ